MGETEFELDAPIPGMSLTTEPGNRPWENPPQLTSVEEVVEYYVPRVSEEDRAEELMMLLEQGVAVNFLVENMITAGLMSGLHTLEAGLLAAPVLAELIKGMAEIEDVKYVESYADKRKKLSPVKQQKLMKMIEDSVDESRTKELETKSSETSGDASETEMPRMKGLMARPVAMVAEVAAVDEMPEQETMESM